MLTIHFNGPGCDLAVLEALLAVEPLSRNFEEYGNFALALPDGKGTRFWGNFANISHAFQVDTDEPETIERLTAAIRANQQTTAYLDQPVHTWPTSRQ